MQFNVATNLSNTSFLFGRELEGLPAAVAVDGRLDPALSTDGFTSYATPRLALAAALAGTTATSDANHMLVPGIRRQLSRFIGPQSARGVRTFDLDGFLDDFVAPVPPRSPH